MSSDTNGPIGGPFDGQTADSVTYQSDTKPANESQIMPNPIDITPRRYIFRFFKIIKHQSYESSYMM